jgi:D-sedoheptulose 7-phosphate isomerase
VNYIEELTQALQRLDIAPLISFVQACEGTLWLAGNGGSMSIAQHWACDLAKAANRRVQALGSNPAVLTAWSNDVSYAGALAEELRRLARDGDCLIALSCSGRSENILTLFTIARRREMPMMFVCGVGAPTYTGIPAVTIPHAEYGIIEDCFGAIGHWLTEALCS